MDESKHIYFCKGYKYQLRRPAYFQTNIYPPEPIELDLVYMGTDGLVIVRKYFAWDGASGPTWDDHTNMAASLLHDVLYYLIRIGKLDPRCRLRVDDELWRRMVIDGAFKIRANYYCWAVNTFGRSGADPKNKRKVLMAPKPKKG